MIFGVEYVVAAYLIWVCTFLFYVLLTKRHMKIAGQTVEAIKQRISESSEKVVNIENQE